MTVQFEQEVCKYLGLPSIPKKEWDGKTAFDKGVAVVDLFSGGSAYAVASFDPETDESIRIKKVFGSEPFTPTKQVYLVPDYMETDMTDADLDSESKKKAEEIIKETEALTAEEEEEPLYSAPKNEYIFPEITSDEQAIAYIAAYNKQNKIRGQVPTNHETIIMRLAVIHNEVNNKNNKTNGKKKG